MSNLTEYQQKNLSVIETELYELAVNEGFKPISTTLSMQMYQLFLEGYTCKDIAKVNSSFSEKDIVYFRVKNNWDAEKEEYALKLRLQVQDKMAKQKLESVEFLTNMLAVTHKQQREQMLRYLQSGKAEDLPETWIKGSKGYKETIEILQKITGEDKVSKHKIESESNINITTNGGEVSSPMLDKIQDALLKRLSKE